MKQFASGASVGNGAAINVELGWIPNLVMIYNATDGTPLNTSWIGQYVIPFSDGGDTDEIKAGEYIAGATSGARARVEAVLLYSGAWATGDAAGFFVVNVEDVEGVFGSEVVAGEKDGGDATVTAAVVHGHDIDTEVAADNAGVTPYFGDPGLKSKGFTIATALATEAKLLRWAAWRDT